MFLGIDLGTTEIKVVIVDDKDTILSVKKKSLSIQREQPLWSEQHPSEWWDSLCMLLDEWHNEQPDLMAQIKAIGLSGQMHGAVIVDKNGEVLRPAILWNDGRTAEECLVLKQRIPEIEAVTGNLVMAGFTAPKLAWIKRHEPTQFKKIAKVLLPKDYLRYCLSGEYVTECSDASGTLWLDVQRRGWSEMLLAGCDLMVDQMPTLIEGNQTSGYVMPLLAKRWGLRNDVLIAGGAGDNAASAIGMGISQPGEGFVSLGTSGVIFVCNDHFQPNPEQATHAFCHALPHRWHQMAVMLSAASALSWVTRITGYASEAAAVEAVEQLSDTRKRKAPLFLPYLSGERTPHNNPYAQGMWWGLTHSHESADLVYAVLEGVSFGLLDGLKGLDYSSDPSCSPLALVGGGARSEFWGQLLANILQIELVTQHGSEVAASLGAARLARCAAGEEVLKVCRTLPVIKSFMPHLDEHMGLMKRYHHFRDIYTANSPFFTANTVLA